MASRKKTDPTVEALRDIQDEVQKLCAEIRHWVSGTDKRLEELGRRQVDADMRTATALLDNATALRELRDMIQAFVGLRATVMISHEDRLASLERAAQFATDHERRIAALEAKAG